MECTDRFSGETTTVLPPPTVLNVLLVNKRLYEIALPSFFGRNNFDFQYSNGLHDFKLACQFRATYIRKLTLTYHTPLQRPALKWSELQEFFNLESAYLSLDRKNVNIRFSNARNLATAWGVKDFLKFRGIKKLEIVGEDQYKDASPRVIKVGVEDERAIGPLLRKKIMQPRAA